MRSFLQKKVLVITTAQTIGPIVLPRWMDEQHRADLFVINPMGLELTSPDMPFVRETFIFSGETGLSAKAKPRLFLRAHNEVLRRSFRELLRWGRWDALVINGVLSVVPLLGDRGLEIPRGLSWVVYHERTEDALWLKQPTRPLDLTQRRLKNWDRLLRQKAVEVVADTDAPRLELPVAETASTSVASAS